MKILLLSDIHANYAALKAIDDQVDASSFDLVLNGGDTLVYGPYPNQTIDWLRDHRAISILGNTDRHVLTLLDGNTFKKPRKADKRIMYGWTAAELSAQNVTWLRQQPLSRIVALAEDGENGRAPHRLLMCHGSPADPDEFLFPDTPSCRMRELAAIAAAEHCTLVTVGHSHTPFSRESAGINFINPGSAGRMFDGKLRGGCAGLSITEKAVESTLHRIPYPGQEVVDELTRLRLPPIYTEMYLRGRKLN